ncbi:MAG: AzlD domain-containing protein [Clostridiales bacterium]|nr:AzlD domain-containing protein [Clostridiales bacterium]
MPLSTTETLFIVAVVAVITFLTRALPFLLFRGEKELPRTVAFLGEVLPPAIIAVLIVYCLKDVSVLKGAANFLPELLAVLVVAGLHLWRRNTLLSIGGGTLCYMLLVQFVFL